ncbi:9468_t:CDS:2 [Funneliformis geosporum]|uniref:16407_t:CDS:1 n=1 Tax=Funneliformis geosporum TaxID=1117311 RepID=A0A9W4STJ9_9GLOM|nr:9468_t:CDS:2 [Funneliformis geosporum]CAI2180838.1 16407_t:CDS:2 [Funneliformis geosporum]
MPIHSTPIPPSYPQAIIHRQHDGEYWFELEGRITHFIIPTIEDVMRTCKVASRKPPTVFIIFRSLVQRCMRLLKKYEQHQVSKVSSELWKHVKMQMKDLHGKFQSLYEENKKQWKKRDLIFEYYNPTSSNDKIVSSTSNEMKTLTSSEEIQITEELFVGLAHVPGFNYYLGNPSY